MLKANEYSEMDAPILHSRFNNVYAAHQIVELMIADSMESIDVQPPTSESLTASVLKGIEVGRALYEQGFSGATVTEALSQVIRESFFTWYTNDNAISFKTAAEEAVLASQFRFLSVDFENPLDVDKGVMTYNPITR